MLLTQRLLNLLPLKVFETLSSSPNRCKIVNQLLMFERRLYEEGVTLESEVEMLAVDLTLSQEVRVSLHFHEIVLTFP